MKDKALFINPICLNKPRIHKRMNLKILKEIAKNINADILGLNTKSKQEFREEIKKRSKDYDTFIFIGGDGTLSDGINSLYGMNKTIGIIPRGTGNANKYNLNLRYFKNRICEIINREKTIKIDIMKINDEIYSLFSDVGYLSYIVEQRNNLNIKGQISYAITLIQTLLTPKFYDTHAKNMYIYIDGKLIYEGKLLACIVSKTRFIGAGLQFNPNAKLNDEQLHVALLNNRIFDIILKLPPSYLMKLPIFAPHFTGKKLTILAEEPIPTQCDGEFNGHFNKITYEVIPKAFNFIIG